MDYVLGIDGGGTNTICVIADKKGNLLSKGSGGPSNYLVVGEERTKLSIARAVEAAKRNCSVEISRFKVACLGLAGVFRPASRAMLEKIIKELNIADKVVLEPDVAIALAGAVTDFGVVVITGTGSIAFGMNRNGETKRASGWGYFLGDEGSAYDIGLKAIKASLRAYDGRGDKTLLVSKLVKRLSLATLDRLVERVYIHHMEPHETAALAPIVVEAAKEGDQVARNILMEAGKELGLAAKAVIEGLHMENECFDVALAGGVVDAGDLILKSFNEVTMKIAPKCRIIPPKYDPVIGAVLIALREIGVEIDDDVSESIEVTLAQIQR